jgi:WD40 repeat protein
MATVSGHKNQPVFLHNCDATARTIITGGDDGLVKLWCVSLGYNVTTSQYRHPALWYYRHAETGQLQITLRGFVDKMCIKWMSVSADNRYIAVCSEGTFFPKCEAKLP